MNKLEELYGKHKDLVAIIKSDTVDLQLATRAYRARLFSLSAKICIKDITVAKAISENITVTELRDNITTIANTIVARNDMLTVLSEDIVRTYVALPVVTRPDS